MENSAFSDYLEHLEPVVEQQQKLESRKAAGEEVPDMSERRVLSVRARLFEQRRRIQHVDYAVEPAIFALEQRKHNLRSQWQSDQETLRDRPEEFEWDGLPVYMENGTLMVAGSPDREPQKITPGTLLTGAEWGQAYDLADDEIPVDLKLKYLDSQAHYRMKQLLDQQILHDQIGQTNEDELKQDAYKRMLAYQESDEIEHKFTGLVAERMVRSILLKMQIDGDMDFEVLDTHPDDDMLLKSDLLLRRLKHYRGVDVDVSDGAGEIGIQVTTDPSEATILAKKEQIRRALNLYGDEVVDVVLVQLGPEVVDKMRLAYKNWKRHKQPGGPDELLLVHIKKQLAYAVLERMYSVEELDERWAQWEQRTGESAAG